jgi:DNA-binding IclR family transcriptional regulator
MNRSVIKTAGRVFEVLEYFAECKRPLSVREISIRFRYPLSSTAVLLKSVAELGYLSYDRQRRAFFPTVRVATLGEWVHESLFGTDEIMPLLQRLRDKTEEAVVLAVQNDIYSQYVHTVQSTHVIQFYLSPGTRRPLCMSGTGWAILSIQADEQIESIFNRSQLKLDERHLRGMSYKKLVQMIQRTRSDGYAFSHAAVTPGAGLIAMPLRAGRGGANLAIGVAGVLARLEKNERSIVKAMDEVLKGRIG